MFKSFLASLLLLASSFTFAQNDNAIFLPWPVKAQSGFYGVVNLAQTPPVTLHATGVALEVSDSKESFLGYTPTTQYIFGAYFAANQTIVFQEDTTNPSLDPNIHNVLLTTTDSYGTHLVGHGLLTFDPLRNGDAHTINAIFNFDVVQYWNFLYESHTTWVYQFKRLSNVQINACELQVAFSPASVTQPCK